LQVEKSSVMRIEPATFRLAVMRPTTLGKMVDIKVFEVFALFLKDWHAKDFGN
jgi:hypothetical protein